MLAQVDARVKELEDTVDELVSLFLKSVRHLRMVMAHFQHDDCMHTQVQTVASLKADLQKCLRKCASLSSACDDAAASAVQASKAASVATQEAAWMFTQNAQQSLQLPGRGKCFLRPSKSLMAARIYLLA